MIPGAGWAATFGAQYTKPDGTTGHTWHRMDVVYFDDDGNGWVAPDGGDCGKELRRASYIRGFNGYDQNPKPVSICQAEGWNIRYKAAQGREFTLKVTAWVLYDDGTVRGVQVYDDGPDIIGDPWQPFATDNTVGFEPEGGWPEATT